MGGINTTVCRQPKWGSGRRIAVQGDDEVWMSRGRFALKASNARFND
jgi:hypothetical protein